MKQKASLTKVAALVTIPLFGGGGNAMAQDQRPNILIIHTDEQNFRTLSSYRKYLSQQEAFPWGKDVNVETPNIDHLADNGILFFRCYATSPVSSPSRASFLTGMYPQNVNMHTNDMLLSEDHKTFGESLRENGYATGYFGKLHLNGKPRPGWNPERDFGFTDNEYMYNRGHWKMIIDTDLGGAQFQINEPVTASDSLTFATDYLTNKAIDYIRRNKNNAFCCVLSIPDPHSANQVRSPYDDMYRHLKIEEPTTARKDTTDLPAWSFGNRNQQGDAMEDMTQYFGMIKCIDDNVKRIIDTLREMDVLDNTIIVFTSDHGDMCGQHGLINKSVPMDDSSRVPFIVSYPKKIPQGVVNNNAVSVIDFAPSLLSLCDIESGEEYEGRNLSDLWLGKALAESEKDLIFMRAPTTTRIKSDWDESRTAHRYLWLSVVTPQYKLTYSEHPTDEPWLTDMINDPLELVNCYLNPQYRQVVQSLSRELVEYGAKHKDERMENTKIKDEISKVIY